VLLVAAGRGALTSTSAKTNRRDRPGFVEGEARRHDVTPRAALPPHSPANSEQKKSGCLLARREATDLREWRSVGVATEPSWTLARARLVSGLTVRVGESAL
jgi:hypothetical protein